MKKALGVVAMMLAFNAFAVIPENGWWWNANESGRGFNIEVQNDRLFLASFGYDSSGAPMWIFSGGSMVGDRNYSGELFRASFGQCFGCPYVAPTFVSIGTVTLFFTSSQTATLTVNGFSVAVKRFDFWMNEAVPDGMMGQWSSVIGEGADIFDGERINFNTKGFNSNNGTPFLGGNRHGYGGVTYLAVVSWNASLNAYTALLDSSTSYYRYFVFNTTGFNRVEGTYWLFLKSSQPSGSGTFYQAFRTASAARVLTGVGPGSSKSTPSDDVSAQYDARDALLFSTLRQSEKSAPIEILDSVNELRAVLLQAKEGK